MIPGCCDIEEYITLIILRPQVDWGRIGLKTEIVLIILVISRTTTIGTGNITSSTLGNSTTEVDVTTEVTALTVIKQVSASY
jgi:hypothetical protein